MQNKQKFSTREKQEIKKKYLEYSPILPFLSSNTSDTLYLKEDSILLHIQYKNTSNFIEPSDTPVPEN